MTAACVSNVCGTSCVNHVRDGRETDVDCGGPDCTPCVTGLHCEKPADCRDGVCTAGLCAAATCEDGVHNGMETDVDCGGQACPRCADGRNCAVPSDCRSGGCCSGACFLPTCCDGRRDGDETDVDCGGSCAPCWVGMRCAAHSDCASSTCTNGICALRPCKTDDDCPKGSYAFCVLGSCCAEQCGPGLHCDAALGVLCLCDETSCDQCCNRDFGTCGPGFGENGAYCDHGPGTFCEYCGSDADSCVYGEGDPYCSKIGIGCFTLPPTECVDKNGICHHGDADTACGTNQQPCVACAPGEHCINHACVAVPDGGATDAAPRD